VIYLDSSVAIAHLLSEDRRPPESLWTDRLVSSRLLQYEVWTAVHRAGLSEPLAPIVEEMLATVSFLEMGPTVLTRATEPYPVPVRTLDALHLASLHFLIGQRLPVRLASYDSRMLGAAEAMGIATVAL
jgi:predicted nucleic acid-binding protein